MQGMTPIEAVIAERNRRGWSARDAAAASGGRVSNQTWSLAERSNVIGKKMHQGVMAAFDWNDDWQVNPPATTHAVEAELRGQIRQLAQAVRELLEIEGLDASVLLRGLLGADEASPSVP